jgi:hypothetical protein
MALVDDRVVFSTGADVLPLSVDGDRQTLRGSSVTGKPSFEPFPR